MTFDEWWKRTKPAECDALKEYFIEAWNTAVAAPRDATECARSLLMLADWGEAPHKNEWGAGMMLADVMLTKDETMTIYAHKAALPPNV